MKTEYMGCKFAKNTSTNDVMVKLEDQVMPRNDQGSMIQKDWEINEDIIHRIKTRWLKWKSLSRVICDSKILSKLKRKFYMIIIRPVLLYDIECWVIWTYT